ncbi:MAG: hypothetical protein JXA30_03985 [Deltaproteobacteria bacterium]|nr:hypothetical protein [Deltaproteobacteria bacterium]
MPATKDSTTHGQGALTVADAVQKCRQVQIDVGLPITCKASRINNLPSLMVGFPTKALLEKYIEAVADHIGNPFCDALTSQNREGSFFVIVAGRWAKQFSCEMQTWTAWVDLDEGDDEEEVSASQGGPDAPKTVSGAMAACRKVHETQDVPVACKAGHIDGVPSMMMGFPSAEASKQYLDVMVEHVAAPFCVAANSSNREAHVYLLLGTRWIRRWNCEVKQWGEWVDLEQTRSQQPATKTY